MMFGAGARVAAASRLFFEPEVRLRFGEGGPVLFFNFSVLFSLRR